MIQPKAQTQPSSHKTAKAGDFPDLQWPVDTVGGVVLGVLGAARGLAHLPILLGALMLLRLSPLSLQMAPANQIKTKLN